MRLILTLSSLILHLELLEEIVLNDLETFLFCILNLLVSDWLMTLNFLILSYIFMVNGGPPFFFRTGPQKCQGRPCRYPSSRRGQQQITCILFINFQKQLAGISKTGHTKSKLQQIIKVTTNRKHDPILY